MKKVLLVMNDDVWRRGGPVFLLDWIHSAPKSEYSFTIYFTGAMTDRSFAQLFLDQGAQIHTGDIPNTGRFKKNLAAMRDLSALMKREKYDIVNIHTPTPPFSAIGLIVARRCGASCRLTHSHTSFPHEGWKKRLYYALPRAINRRLSACYAGVSGAAVRSMFGRQAEDRGVVISPRIDAERFAFSQEARMACRERLSLEGSFVIGHVGAFSPVKNHGFLVDVFRLVAQTRKDARLMLIGTGEEEPAIRRQVRGYGLEDKVTFVGQTDKVQEYMCAMDIFVLPSLREGAPIVLLEAQASGLPCVVSDVVSQEESAANQTQYLSVQDGCEKWAQCVLETEPLPAGIRQESWKRILEAGMDIGTFPAAISGLYDAAASRAGGGKLSS